MSRPAAFISSAMLEMATVGDGAMRFRRSEMMSMMVMPFFVIWGNDAPRPDPLDVTGKSTTGQEGCWGGG